MLQKNENKQPLLSVIIPTYNRPEYLKQAIASAVNQTFDDIEIIVSDNCSPQNPQAIVESFNDSRIRFSRNSSNLGMFANTIKAFRMARGKYVASLLDDDMWEKDFLAKLIPPLEANPDLALAFCDHYLMDAQGNIDDILTQECSQLYKRDHLTEGIYQPFSRIALVDKSVSTATAAVIRRDVIDWNAIPAEVGGSWDIYLNYLCSRSGLGAYYYPEKLTRYRVHEQTDTMLSGKRDPQAKIRKAQADMFCYKQFMSDERLSDLKPYFQQQWAHVSTTLGIGLMRSQRLKEARAYFWSSLKESIKLRTLAGLMLSFTPPPIASKF
jgi:glycosyltransferase involved in cell wall biosynthesis